MVYIKKFKVNVYAVCVKAEDILSTDRILTAKTYLKENNADNLYIYS